MGLMHLLAMGRSLRKVRDQANRYKLTQQSLLPKFGPAKPQESQQAGKPESQPAGSINTTRTSAEKTEKVMNATAAMLPQMQARAADEPRASRPAPRASDPEPKQAFPLGRWTIFRNPFSRAPKPAGPVAPPQGQLMLDLVKPVRNDLSDSDLEVVAVRETAGQPIEKSAGEKRGGGVRVKSPPLTSTLSPQRPFTPAGPPARWLSTSAAAGKA
jgi:hypothetical protein